MILKQTRIVARDRRMAAIHEAGHVTIGRHIGLIGISARLEKVQKPDVLFDKAWIGQTQYIDPSLLHRTIPSKRMAMFAVAGAVAECCWRGNSFHDLNWDDPDAMSASDWAGCGCEPGNPTRQFFRTIEVASFLLDRETGALWPTLLSEARRLIVESRETRGAVLTANDASLLPPSNDNTIGKLPRGNKPIRTAGCAAGVAFRTQRRNGRRSNPPSHRLEGPIIHRAPKRSRRTS